MSKEGREVGRGVEQRRKQRKREGQKGKRDGKDGNRAVEPGKKNRREGEDGAGPEVGWQGRGKEEKGGKQKVDLGMDISLPEK